MWIPALPAEEVGPVAVQDRGRTSAPSTARTIWATIPSERRTGSDVVAGVGVAVGCGSGVAVGSAVGVAVGRSVGVGVGTGVAVGADVRVGAGVGASAARPTVAAGVGGDGTGADDGASVGGAPQLPATSTRAANAISNDTDAVRIRGNEPI